MIVLLDQGSNIIDETTIDLVGAIGRQVLNHLMPDRRLRVSPRAVKRPLSRHVDKSRCIDRRTYRAALNITILAGQPTLTTQPDP